MQTLNDIRDTIDQLIKSQENMIKIPQLKWHKKSNDDEVYYAATNIFGFDKYIYEYRSYDNEKIFYAYKKVIYYTLSDAQKRVQVDNEMLIKNKFARE